MLASVHASAHGSESPTIAPVIIFACGGTGGHIFPALAIAEAWRAAHPGWQIRFMGAEGGMEEKIVADYGFPIDLLPVAGLRRSLTVQNLKRNLSLPFKLLRAYRQCRRLFRLHVPRIVIGTGGYASFMPVWVAQKQKIPTALQEQNAYPGLATRMLSKKAGRVFLAYKEASAFLKTTNWLHVGNPVRAALSEPASESTVQEAKQVLGLAADKPVVTLLGGSLGALALNKALETALPLLEQLGASVIWQCGRRYEAMYSEVVAGKPWMKLMPFIEDMPSVYAASDVLVCRAGAITLSEVMAQAKAAILVPSPNVAEDHQTKNAQVLAQEDAAILIQESELSSRLEPALKALLEDEQRRNRLAANANKMYQHNTVQTMLNAIQQLL